MPKVGIFSLGFLTLNIPKLCRFLNFAQKYYIKENIKHLIEVSNAIALTSYW
jgi:hypothetical protein